MKKRFHVSRRVDPLIRIETSAVGYCRVKGYFELGIFIAGTLCVVVNPLLAQNWMQSDAPAMNWRAIVSSVDGTKLVAAAGESGMGGVGGPIFYSTNSGATWTQTGAPLQDWWTLASSADASKLVAVGFPTFPSNGGWIYRSVDCGTTWNQT